MHTGCFAAYVCVPSACSVQGDQKRASDPLELELEVVSCPHVGSGK